MGLPLPLSPTWFRLVMIGRRLPGLPESEMRNR
jgi:hypothetical protein